MRRRHFAIAFLSLFAALSTGFIVDAPELKPGDDQIVLPGSEVETAFDNADSFRGTLIGDKWVAAAQEHFPAIVAQAANSCISAYLACTDDCKTLVGAARGACLRHCRAERDECLGN